MESRLLTNSQSSKLKSLYSIVCQRDGEKAHPPLTKYSPEERKRPMYYRSGNSTIMPVGTRDTIGPKLGF